MATATKDRGRAEFLNASEIITAEASTFTVQESVVDVFPSPPADATHMQTLRLIEQSGSLDFWNEEGEDIYTHDDGEAI